MCYSGGPRCYKEANLRLKNAEKEIKKDWSSERLERYLNARDEYDTTVKGRKNLQKRIDKITDSIKLEKEKNPDSVNIPEHKRIRTLKKRIAEGEVRYHKLMEKHRKTPEQKTGTPNPTTHHETAKEPEEEMAASLPPVWQNKPIPDGPITPAHKYTTPAGAVEYPDKDLFPGYELKVRENDKGYFHCVYVSTTDPSLDIVVNIGPDTMVEYRKDRKRHNPDPETPAYRRFNDTKVLFTEMWFEDGVPARGDNTLPVITNYTYDNRTEQVDTTHEAWVDENGDYRYAKYSYDGATLKDVELSDTAPRWFNKW